MNSPIDFRIIDLLDILLVAFIIYQVYQLIKGTAAIRIFLGILAIYILWKIVSLLQMTMLSEILGQFIGVGVIALLIVFQKELRQFLLLIGTRSRIRGKSRKYSFQNIFGKSGEESNDYSAVLKACIRMANSRTGALIVLTRSSDLESYIKSGLKIDAKLSAPLLESIFYKNNPIHDGAVLISNNKIKLARGVLPVSESEELRGNLGMRHRSALGIAEQTDAVVIVVSEQTGDFSIAMDGDLRVSVNEEELSLLLKSL